VNHAYDLRSVCLVNCIRSTSAFCSRIYGS